MSRSREIELIRRTEEEYVYTHGFQPEDGTWKVRSGFPRRASLCGQVAWVEYISRKKFEGNEHFIFHHDWSISRKPWLACGYDAGPRGVVASVHVSSGAHSCSAVMTDDMEVTVKKGDSVDAVGTWDPVSCSVRWRGKVSLDRAGVDAKILAVSAGKSRFAFVGGGYTVTAHGIEDDPDDKRDIPGGKTFSECFTLPDAITGMGVLHKIGYVDGRTHEFERGDHVLAYTRNPAVLYCVPRKPGVTSWRSK